MDQTREVMPNPAADWSMNWEDTTASTAMLLQQQQQSQPHQQPPQLPPQQQLPQQPQVPLGITGPGKRSRASVACRRCRRLRTKCIHDNGKAPCERCKSAGKTVAEVCVFVTRNRRDSDREYRRPKIRSRHSSESLKTSTVDKSSSEGNGNELQLRSPNSTPTRLELYSLISHDQWSLLPPFEEVVEGCRVFSTSCFQVGFIPKTLFLERLTKKRKSISVFLLLSLLSVSARHTPALRKRYGDASKATQYFISRAGDLIGSEIYEPSLERMQALFCLGVSEWVQGNRTRSAMHMGIAVRMASIFHLHREETYALSPNATTKEVIHSESKRRTFWLLESQEHLYTEYNAVVPFSLKDISAQLPCNENDFAFGIVPRERAVVAGTEAASRYPELCNLPNRSLFATVVQGHNLWGQVARRAGRAVRSEREKGDATVTKPWEPQSDYLRLTQLLKEWEDNIPPQHKWSEWNFRGYKAKFLDRGYLSEVIVTRLSNIIIRRIYLDEILEYMLGQSDSGCPIPDFWSDMSCQLFSNIHKMHEIVDTYCKLRLDNEGTPAILVFCIYICGSLASYLWKYPQLCPQLSSSAEGIVNQSLEVLHALLPHWPIATRWLDALRKVACAMQAESREMSSAETEGMDNGPLMFISSLNELPPVSLSTPIEASAMLSASVSPTYSKQMSLLHEFPRDGMDPDRDGSFAGLDGATINYRMGQGYRADGLDFPVGFDFDGELIQFL